MALIKQIYKGLRPCQMTGYGDGFLGVFEFVHSLMNM